MDYSYSLKKLQSSILDIAKDFDLFCRENNLNYMIAGGTLLGAVRHNGFIPWDDDFDVAMPRKDFERFISIWEDTDKYELMKSGDFGYYKVMTPAKIIIKGTRLIEKYDVELCVPDALLTQGIFLDIFPLDFYPDNGFGDFLNKKVGLFYALKSLSMFDGFDYGGKLWVRFLIKITPLCFIKFIVSLGKRIVSADFSSKMLGYAVDSSISNLWIDKCAIFPFEKKYNIDGLMFYGPKDSHAYLSMRFGDYMKPPCEDDRKAHVYEVYVNGVKVYIAP